MGYHPPSPISNDGWGYHQETSNSGHSNSWSYASEPQDEKENHMGYQPPPQNDSYHYPHGRWKHRQRMEKHPPSRPSFSFESSSSLDYASTQSFLQNPYQSSHRSHNSFHTPQHNFTTTHSLHQNYSRPSSLELKDEEYLEGIELTDEEYREGIEIQRKLVEFYTKSPSWEETILEQINGSLEQTRGNLEPSTSEDEDKCVGEEVEKQDKEATASSELSMKNEVVEPETTLEMTREHEDSQLSQTSLDQNASTSESMIERYNEEIKKCWEDRQTSPMIERLKQLLGVKEEVEEQESEEVIPNSSEAEKYIKEEFMEPPIQKALDEYKTPKITQLPKHGFKEVKAINKSTKKRIVTKLPRTTFKRRSTTSNPTPGPIASKLNQAMYKRKLAEERPRQGVIAESSSPLKSFLLTNWKKRKKVKNR
ncbi:hypothetical protein AHAS_Ahas13G0317400 [Arachis hypogaea]